MTRYILTKDNGLVFEPIDVKEFVTLRDAVNWADNEGIFLNDMNSDGFYYQVEEVSYI